MNVNIESLSKGETVAVRGTKKNGEPRSYYGKVETVSPTVLVLNIDGKYKSMRRDRVEWMVVVID